MPRFRLKKTSLVLVTLTVILLTLYNLNSLSHDAIIHPFDHYYQKQQHHRRSSDGLPNFRNELNDDEQQLRSSRPWFMVGGAVRPSRAKWNEGNEHRILALWPEENRDDDRIVNQLMFVPPLPKVIADPKTKRPKRILLNSGLGKWRTLKVGRSTFLENSCPIDECELTTDRKLSGEVDAIVFTDHILRGNLKEAKQRPWWQVWILYLLECPLHTHSFRHKNVYNWTATYRRDSDIVTPYEKFVPYHTSSLTGPHSSLPLRNYALNKTKKVAWFVSNCGAQNGRSTYATHLGKHIRVDVFGTCGTMHCPRNDQARCFSILNADYKFYLSFENSNCKDYITEKFFVNGLSNDVIPIVYGASKEDYLNVAPPHSFIHVEDFDSPQRLADYLHLLDNNDTLYNEYFRWKGTGEFVNTFFWCRVCALLHDKDRTPKHYTDVEEWWRGPGVCRRNIWDRLNMAPPTVKNHI